MPDITMCQNDRCPLKHKCYRYKAKPSEYRQAYAVFEFYKSGSEYKCDYFWPLEPSKPTPPPFEFSMKKYEDKGK